MIFSRIRSIAKTMDSKSPVTWPSVLNSVSMFKLTAISTFSSPCLSLLLGLQTKLLGQVVIQGKEHRNSLHHLASCFEEKSLVRLWLFTINDLFVPGRCFKAALAYLFDYGMRWHGQGRKGSSGAAQGCSCYLGHLMPKNSSLSSRISNEIVSKGKWLLWKFP